MSPKRKRKPNRSERQSRQETREQIAFDAVVEDTAATFTCSTEMAHDLAWQCSNAIEEVEDELLFNRIAHEIWREQPVESNQLAQTIEDFIAERERHQAALTALETRFKDLETADEHHHLEPIETYRERVRGKLSDDMRSESTRADEGGDRRSDSNGF